MSFYYDNEIAVRLPYKDFMWDIKNTMAKNADSINATLVDVGIASAQAMYNNT